MKILLNILNVTNVIDKKKLNNENIEVEKTGDDGKILVFKCSFWSPFFGLTSIKQKNDKIPFYTIIKFGIIKTKNDPAFFSYNEIENGYEGFDFKIVKKKNFQACMSGININLDENWKIKESKEDNNLKKTIFWISKNDIRYSQLSSEPLDLTSYKTDNIYDFIKLTLLDSNVIPDTINLTSNNNRLICRYEAMDNFYKVKILFI